MNIAFPFELDSSNSVPLYKQLMNGLKESINSGHLRPGDYLPGTKELARQLSISRATVVRTYEELIGQSFLESVSGIGTRVSVLVAPPATPLLTHPSLTEKLSDYAHRIVESNQPLTISDMADANFAGPARELTPIKWWRQSLLKHCRTHDPEDVTYTHQEPFGHLPLREAIADYLRRGRAVRCNVDQVAVFPASLHAVNLVAKVLIDPGDLVAVENPGFPHARDVFQAYGAELMPVGVDANGMIVEQLERINRPIKLVYLTPSHQDPTGGVLPLERRKALLDWASRSGAIIVEDDFDHEYRYESSTIPSIQGMDPRQSVIYISTFWKTLFPLSSAGFMVVPTSLAEVFKTVEARQEGNFPLMEMYALTDFVAEGHLDRFIKKSRSVYRPRLHNLIRQLTLHLRDRLEISRQSSGMHLMVRFRSFHPDDELMKLARISGLPMMSTASYYIDAQSDGEFLIPFAHKTTDEMTAAIRSFAELIGQP